MRGFFFVSIVVAVEVEGSGTLKWEKGIATGDQKGEEKDDEHDASLMGTV